MNKIWVLVIAVIVVGGGAFVVLKKQSTDPNQPAPVLSQAMFPKDQKRVAPLTVPNQNFDLNMKAEKPPKEFPTLSDEQVGAIKKSLVGNTLTIQTMRNTSLLQFKSDNKVTSITRLEKKVVNKSDLTWNIDKEKGLCLSSKDTSKPPLCREIGPEPRKVDDVTRVQANGMDVIITLKKGIVE